MAARVARRVEGRELHHEMLQVVRSSIAEPLEVVIRQLVGEPPLPTASSKKVVPSS